MTDRRQQSGLDARAVDELAETLAHLADRVDRVGSALDELERGTR